MKSGELFRKTMPFAMAKLLLGAVTVIASVILLVILMLIGALFDDGGIAICFLIWLGATGIIRFAVMHYFGYLVKAGHVAVLAEAVTTGKVPDNMVGYGKDKVKERFGEANVYFAVDKLVTGSVKQIQNGIQKLGNAMDFIPGMGAITSAAKFFVNLSLGYIDECCLGYTFYKKDQGAFQSACDGVVIYAQNIKGLLKNAAKTMLKVMLLSLVVVLAVFIPVGILFKVLNWSAFIAFLLALFIAWVIKFAFMDSYILCQTMTSYMEVAPNTQITYDLYSKLSGISSSFKKLYNEGNKEGPRPNAQQPQYAYAGGNPNPQPQNTQVNVNQPQQNAGEKPIFCGQCGAKNAQGAGFCGDCGAKL